MGEKLAKNLYNAISLYIAYKLYIHQLLYKNCLIKLYYIMLFFLTHLIFSF